MKKVDLLSISVSTGSYDEFVHTIVNSAQERRSHYTCVANVHMLVEAYSDYKFASVVSNANVITPDGMPLSWALRMLYGIKQDRVAGMDLLPDLLKRASLQKIPVFFYGGTQTMLKKTVQYIKNNFPELNIAGLYSPPFRTLSASEEEFIIQKINSSGASLVFVALGCPKQEKWMAAMKDRIHAVTVGIGGALPVLVGIQKRAPKWIQNAGMEWSFRLLQEPKRLFKRYAITNTKFLYLLTREYLRQKFIRKVATPLN
ncbi:MAG: WecB/TagA/CpsF family glycosyltransferase [Chitinophagaceae bacterium]|nr:WecB/TagA/CpsF family glycosyltransferase [Chitinophagaceae bacterium]